MRTNIILDILSLIFIICFQSQPSAGSSNFVWQYFYRQRNVAILGGEYRTEENATSRLDCMLKCISSSSVAFHEDTNECRHYTNQNYTIVPTNGYSSDQNIWLSKDMTLAAAQNSESSEMTYEEATELCGLLGGRLASPTELLIAKGTGFHLCSCGWLYGETARYVLAFTDPSCKLDRQIAGLHSCKIADATGAQIYDTHYKAAYCKFNV